MVALDELCCTPEMDIPIVFRDSDPRNSTWLKPALYYGPVQLSDENGTQHVFMLSEVPDPFPDNCYLKEPDEEDIEDEEYE